MTEKALRELLRLINEPGEPVKPFEIRSYGKSELAMLYFPDAKTKKGAMNNLNYWSTITVSCVKNFGPRTLPQTLIDTPVERWNLSSNTFVSLKSPQIPRKATNCHSCLLRNVVPLYLHSGCSVLCQSDHAVGPKKG